MFSSLPLARKNVEKVNFQVDLSGSQLGEVDVPHDGSMGLPGVFTYMKGINSYGFMLR